MQNGFSDTRIIARGFSRRQLLVGAGTLALAGCTMPATNVVAPPLIPQVPIGPNYGAIREVIGNGSVVVALLVPLTGENAAVGIALRNAAELALREFAGNDVRILVYDTGGSDAGARAAAEAALSARVDVAAAGAIGVPALTSGVELIIGPVFAAEVFQVGPLARAAGVPVMAFSTDAQAASPGVYLLGFLADDEIDRVVRAAADEGRRRVAALIPDSPYGNVAQTALQTASGRRGLQVSEIRRYGLTMTLTQAVQAIAAIRTTIDTIFLPQGSDAAAAASALRAAGVTTPAIRFLGTGQWNTPTVYRDPSLTGGWFAAPAFAGLNSFAARYQGAFGAAPGTVATWGYDAALLAAGLVRQAGTLRFDTTVLTDPEGFISSVTGLFRFLPSGTNDRGFAVYECTGGEPRIVAAAPENFVGF